MGRQDSEIYRARCTMLGCGHKAAERRSRRAYARSCVYRMGHAHDRQRIAGDGVAKRHATPATRMKYVQEDLPSPESEPG